MSAVKPGDKQRVLDWMVKNCSGFRCARTRANILPFMGSMDDRYWRAIISMLKHEGHIASSSSRGYWAIIPTTRDKDEVKTVLESYLEMRSKALDLLTDTDRHIKHWQDRMLALTQQGEMF